MFNFAAALEFGFATWLTGAVQWVPGINIWSDVDTGNPLMSGRILDAGDVFFGAKVQILGKDGLVKNEKMRVAFAPGLKVPVAGPDYEEQDGRLSRLDSFTPKNLDNHAFALGFRAYYDLIINDKFFINFFNESMFYTQERSLKKAGYEPYKYYTGVPTIHAGLEQLVAATVTAGVDSLVALSDDKIFYYGDKVKYGYELSFEVEPTYSSPLGPILFTASLPLKYKTTPGAKYDVSYDYVKYRAAIDRLDFVLNTPALSAMAAPAEKLKEGIESLAQIADKLNAGEGQTHAFTMTPTVAVMFYKWKVPFEFAVKYTAPLAGERTLAGHSFVFLAKMFFKFQ